MISDSLAFKILTVIGCWLPIKPLGKLGECLYWLYTAFIAINFSVLYVLQVTYMLIEIGHDTASVIEVLVLHTSVMFFCFKMQVLIFKRKQIFNLDNKLSDPLVIANTENEIMIQKSCKERSKLITSAFVASAEVCALIFCVFPFIGSKENIKLPVTHWIPFEVNETNFYKIFTWHVFLLFIGAAIDTSTDCIFVEFIDHGCAMLKILNCRIEAMTEIIKSARRKNMKIENILLIEKKILRTLYKQHQLIFE